jgi:hypothetical protein
MGWNAISVIGIILSLAFIVVPVPRGWPAG